jgi:hypothetical protein
MTRWVYATVVLRTSAKETELREAAVASAEALAALARWVARRGDGARHEREPPLLEGIADGATPEAGGSHRSPGTPAAAAGDAGSGQRGRGGR